MEGESRTRKRDRMRSFVIGGIVGAGAAVAAGRRLRPRTRPRQTPAGLAAAAQVAGMTLDIGDADVNFATVNRVAERLGYDPSERSRSTSSR